ncbi:MAG: EAL domain-containing protein [Acidaminococcus sp.]|uniref:EAL domain-containing protein n=1 Tax=Acidaminococcus sp. TaxID=1872103 RepID=UPI003F13CD28
MVSFDNVASDDLKQYVVTHFDEALEKHWIKLYLQPIVRILTGNLCAYEGLARWQDPKEGLLSPAVFIPVLEETGQIHRLDQYMIEEIMKVLRYGRETGYPDPVVPISFNLSRQDFTSMDVYTCIETLRQKYDVPRDLLRIEITESIVAQAGDRVLPVVDLLRSTGYDVWMDDFGSGYSSLNILNHIDVDLLKLDIDFLHHFTEKSRQIVIALITMAKRLNMHTLAEGVETPEQLEFLKEIGCDRAQGYLFSQPLPVKQVLQKMEGQGRKGESRRWRHYYDEAGHAIRESRQPRCLLEYDGASCSVLTSNQPAQDLRKAMGFADRQAVEQVQLDSSLRSLYFFYDSINMVDFTTGTLAPLFVHNSQFRELRPYLNDLPKLEDHFVTEWMLREDRDRYRAFIDLDTQQRRLKDSPKGLLADCFRVRNRDGSFTWKEIAVMLVPETDGNKALFTIRDIPYGSNQQPADPVVLPARTVSEAALWNQLMRNTPFYYFWKDRQRRFLGASQSFLDVYGFPSLQDILGKNDEDLGWHVDGDRYRADEWAVLEEGRSFRDVPGQCIIRGRLRHIAASKWPMYDHGQIVGLMGMFYDVDELRKQGENMLHQSYTDQVTGLMNQHGFVDALLSYEERCFTQKQRYGVILCLNRNNQSIMDSFGEELSREVLRKQADCLRDRFGNRAVLARLGRSRYGVILEIDTPQELEEQAKGVVEDMNSIHRVWGNEMTMDFVAATAHCSEGGLQGSVLYQEATERLDKIAGK